VTLLGYSYKEARFLTIDEICRQYETYCRFNGIPIDGERNDSGFDFPDSDEEVIE